MNFITEIMHHSDQTFSDKHFWDLVIDEKEPEMAMNKSLADDALDINPMVAIKNTCPEIYVKLSIDSLTLVRKHMRNTAAHVILVELDKKCRDINAFILNKKATAAESTEITNKHVMSDSSYTKDLTLFVKTRIYFNPVWDLGF